MKPMIEEEKRKHTTLMAELNEEWSSDQKHHELQRLNKQGIRSSQISALIAYLIKKGIL